MKYAEMRLTGMSTYWGTQVKHCASWYFGAVICFLFIFGLLVVKSRIKMVAACYGDINHAAIVRRQLALCIRPVL